MVVGVPERIEIVVTSGEPRVQRAFGSRLLCVDRRIVVRVSTRKYFLAAAEDLETVDEAVFASGEVAIENVESLFVKPDAGRCSHLPGSGWPGDRGSLSGTTDADTRKSCRRDEQSARDPADRLR